MSIKDLFGKRSNQILTVEQYEKTVERNAESVSNLDERSEDQSRFVPRASVDFDDPKTFARYGSAEKYYIDAINSILNTYPYDGSLAERTAWHNGATYVDNYFFENEYPRTTGYISTNNEGEHPEVSVIDTGGISYRQLTSPQFVYVKGGPNPTPQNPTGELKREFPEKLGKSNLWQPDLQRESNLYCNGSLGNTVEFWFKLDEDRAAVSGNLCLFDLWNNHELGADEYSRFLIELPPAADSSLLKVTYVSGSSGTTETLGSAGGFDFSSWNHFAVSVFNAEDTLCTRLYINGNLVEEIFSGTPVGSFIGETNHLTSTIGALQYKAAPTAENMYGSGAPRGSFDEFRFWKSVRNSEEVGRHWFTQVYGGNNTDQSNVDLGVYYKFNEGVVNTEQAVGFDRQVLDYSGRVSNGSIVNYSTAVRSLGSAIDDRGDLKNVEFRDPIVYRSHPDVQELLKRKKLEGSSHDMSNNAAIYNTMPEWITTADDEQAGHNLLDLTQIISSYFDTLHLQIEALPSLTNTHYVQDGEKPLPFAKHLLESVGFIAPEIFIDTSVLEALSDRNEERVFEEKLHNVKNLIYQNIYNNVAGIYKAKGTEKAFRNLLRCFGVGDELIKINLYGDGVTHKLEDSYRSVSVKKNYLDFNNVDRHDSTVYQQAEPDNADSTSYISGDNAGKLDYIPFTMEASVIFPNKFEIDHPEYYPMTFGFTEAEPSSMFGMHQAKDDEADLSWLAIADCDFGFRAVCIKEEELSSNAKFRFDVRGFGFAPNADNDYHNGVFETEYFYDVYDNTRWNFAVRVRTDKQPDLVHDSDVGVKYYLEFYGVSTVLEQVQEEFIHSVEIDSVSAKAALNANKRVFLGAEYVDFNDNTSGSINDSDVKIGEVRFWQDYLDNDTIKYHAQDPDNYGVKDPYKPAYFNQTSVDKRVPQIDTLALYWDFATVTAASPSDGIDEAGNILSDSFFYIDDVSSGNNIEAAATGRYGWLGKIIKKQHTGKGDYYYPEDRHVVDRNFLFAAKQNLPEIIGSTDTVKFLTQDDEYFVKNSKPVNYFWAIEKSMYQAISQEIVEAFAGINSFNNLIGDPVNRYRMEYKGLNKLRQLFFQKFDNEPKVERYIKFYKWIDSSINEMIKQLIPASANFSDDMRTMIESHVLERNKYWTKYPSLEMKQTPPESPVLGINEMLYNWRLGRAAIEENNHCLWWKQRAERSGALSTGDSETDSSREQILHVATTKNDGDYVKKKLAREIGGVPSSYDGSTFVLRSLSTPYRFGVDAMRDIHGGVNNKASKKIDYVRSELAADNTVSVSPRPQPTEPTCDDYTVVDNPLLKKRLEIESADMNGSMVSLYELNKDLATGQDYWNSNHSDSYGEDKEVPMQGVFTSVHVGGLQNRHVPLNDGSDTEDNRPEAWNFTLDGDSGVFEPVDVLKPRAVYYRDEKAKRSVNIKNIKSSYGNYRFDYDVVQTSGRSNNNRWLAENGLDAESTHSTSSDYILGMYDFALPSRGRNEHIFSERFSAPGSSDTLSRGMLDVEAEEFALYNSMNYRNLDVRIHLQNWLTYHTKRWGYRSFYRGIPSPDCENPGDTDSFCEANFHKFHRNTSYRPEPYDYIEFSGSTTDVRPTQEDPCCDCDDDDYAETILTDYRCKETHDNFWVTHQLPRSGHQYSWIKASTQRDIFEEVDGEAKIYQVCPWGYATDYPNSTAYHPEIDTDPRAKIIDTSVYSKMVVEKEIYEDSQRVKTEHGFPFLNKFIKYDSENHPKTYEEILGKDLPGCSESYRGTSTLGMNILSEETFRFLENEISLNDILLHRNGPYQHPTWKQIRGYENPLVLHQRKNNVISMIDLPDTIRVLSSGAVQLGESNSLVTFRERRSQTARNYVEPAVSWNVPMRSKLQFHNSPAAATIVHSYSNNLEVFANPYLDRRLGLQKTARQFYDILAEKYMDPNNSFAPQMFELVYSEHIFPKHRNTTLDKVRRRRHYAESPGYDGYDQRATTARTFWNSDEKRERTRWDGDEGDTVGLNSLGAPVRRSSVWALDYDPRIERDCVDVSCLGKNVAVRGDLVWAGEAQYQGYVRDGVVLDTIEPEFMEDGLPSPTAWVSPRPRLQFIHNPRTNKAQEHAWSWKAADISGLSPWYENYDEYSKDVRLIGQNYSLTPEYNVSSHMEFYINENAGNFRARNKNILELQGVGKEISSSAEKYSSETTYFSWDGSKKVYKWTEEPNFAEGWNAYFTGMVEYDPPYRQADISELCPLQLPTAIDSPVANSWQCADPYPVSQFGGKVTGKKGVDERWQWRSKHFVSVDFTESFELRATTGVFDIPESEARGIPVGAASAINWSEIAAADYFTYDQKALILERWENSVMFSVWIKPEGTRLGIGKKHGILELTGGSLKVQSAPVFGTYPGGSIFDISKKKEELFSIQSGIKNVETKLNEVRRIRPVSSSSKVNISQKIDQLDTQLTRLVNEEVLIRNLLASVPTKPKALVGGQTHGYLYISVGHEKGDLIWADNNGNKIIFDITIDEMEDRWNNICLYYIGGGLDKQNDPYDEDTYHRVVLFVDGAKVSSYMHEEAQDYFSDYVDDGIKDAVYHNGSLLRLKGRRYPFAFSTMHFGKVGGENHGIDHLSDLSEEIYFKGKATDLTVYRGNPGITIRPQFDDERYDISHNDPNDNRWFLDASQVSSSTNFYSSLAETIYEQQCENANDIFSDWREVMDVCKPYVYNPSDFLVPFLPPVQVSVINIGPLEVIDLDLKDDLFTGVAPPQGGGMTWGLTIPVIENIDLGLAAEGASAVIEAGEAPPPPLVPEGLPPSLETPPQIEEDSSTGSGDEIKEPELIPQNTNTACAEMIGWWKLGVPRWTTEYCEEYVWREDFFKCYSHTDTIPHIEKVREDHKSLNDEGSVSMMRLEVGAIKKLLPYNGFYPSQRAMQLGALFYDCVVPYVQGENDNQAFDRARTEQAALQPFFAPGILFNTIKSGIAVDWAAYSGEASEYRDGVMDLVSKAIDSGLEERELIEDEELKNSAAGKVIANNVAVEFERNVSLGRLQSQQEKEVFIKKSYARNLLNVKKQVSAYKTQVQNICTQEEYISYAKTKKLDPQLSSTEAAFKAAYSCPEFKANSSSAIPALSPRLKSVLGTGGLTNAKQISSKAAGVIAHLDKLPKTITVKIPPYPFVGEGVYLDSNPDFRIPFEGLVSLNSYLPQKNSSESSKVFFLAPSHYKREVVPENNYPYFEWSGVQNPLYEMAMNNFLAEVPNFFLKEGKFTTFASAPENKFKTVKKGWTYYLDVHLYKTEDFEMTISPHDGTLFPLESDASGKTFTTQGRYYGPAMRFQSQAEAASTDFPVGDPAQAAYTPPYFYGRAKARLSFTATQDGQPTLEEILNNLEIEYINEEMDELFSSRSTSETVAASDIFLTALGQRNPPWKQTPAYQSRMPMESCIKFDGKTNEKKTSYAALNTATDFTPDGTSRLSPQQVEDDNQGTGVWVISPRFECPTFNFKTTDNLDYRQENRCGTGMWGGYGSIPVESEQKEQGLFISIEESFKQHEGPRKPLLCEKTKKQIQTVALGIRKDTRYLHENTITLEDPYGNIETITIGQPSNSSFDSWGTARLDGELAEQVGIPSVTPYGANSLVRTVGTSPDALRTKPYRGMSNEFDIEGYFQAESWMTDVFSLWSTPTSGVPLASDVANAIQYHINYLYNNNENFCWKASVEWTNPAIAYWDLAGPSSIVRYRQNLDKPEYSKLQGTVYAIVEIEYDESKAKPGDKNKIHDKPMVTLSVNQDSVRNPLGRLGIRYLTENSSEDKTYDELDPESQKERSFYPRESTETIVNCVRAVGSLIDICGFTPTKSRIGELTPSKEMSEAVVMVPFVDNPIVSESMAATIQVAGRNFFEISRDLFKETEANVNAGKPAILKDGVYNVASNINHTSVSNMIKMMQKYNLPPQYDFLKYSQVNPFVMYMFEFKEELDSEDLSNIWQGVMPKISMTAKQDVSIIEHEMNEINFFEGKKVPQNIRWMVFRVKRKAKVDYWQMTADSVDDDRFKFDFKFGSNSKPDYSYNWPYDFCSLVELCRVKGGVSIMPKGTGFRAEEKPLLSDIERRRVVSKSHSQSGTSSGAQATGLLDWAISNQEDE